MQIFQTINVQQTIQQFNKIRYYDVCLNVKQKEEIRTSYIYIYYKKKKSFFNNLK